MQSLPQIEIDPKTRAASTRRQLAAWFDGRPLDDAVLVAYVGHLQQTRVPRK